MKYLDVLCFEEINFLVYEDKIYLVCLLYFLKVLKKVDVVNDLLFWLFIM